MSKPCPPEVRAKISASHKASPLARAHLAKLHAAQRGVKRIISADWRAKIVASNRGRKRSLETRAKMSAAQIGHEVSSEARAKMRAAKLGRSLSADHRAKLSAAHKASLRARAHIAWLTARPVSPETRAKLSVSHKTSPLAQAHQAQLSASQKGRFKSPETGAKISAALKGHTMSLEARAKSSASHKTSPRAQAHRARIGRIRPTSIEVQLRNALNAAGVEFVFQFPVPATSYVADFYLPRTNTILEADGGYWHSRPKSVLHDAKRDAALTRLGYRVVRLGEKQIRAGARECVGALTA